MNKVIMSRKARKIFETTGLSLSVDNAWQVELWLRDYWYSAVIKMIMEARKKGYDRVEDINNFRLKYRYAQIQGENELLCIEFYKRFYFEEIQNFHDDFDWNYILQTYRSIPVNQSEGLSNQVIARWDMMREAL